SASTTVMNPIGRLTRKTQRQLSVTSKPPTVGPAAAAIPATAVQIPSAQERRSTGTAFRRIESEVGVTAAAPAAWINLAAVSEIGPTASAHRAEAIVKRRRPPTKTRRWPIRSARRPAGTSKAAKTIAKPLRIHDRLERLLPAKSR